MIIEAKNLRKIYKLPYYEIEALKGITFQIEKGEFISIMGPSGAGKTTLLNLIGALDTPTSGKLRILEYQIKEDFKESALLSLRRKNIGFVFEEFLLIQSLSAVENVFLPLYFLGDREGRPDKILEELGLRDRLEHLPYELSGGELQRVAIARALATSPKILIADEPTGNLDTNNAKYIFSLFKRLNEELGITIIVATHNIKLAYFSKRIIHLLDGRIIKDERISD
jgi:putative ABC transport system ATP-binding protein